MLRLFDLFEKQSLIYVLGCLINIFSFATSALTAQSNNGLSFSVSYLLMNDASLSSNDLTSIDRAALARKLEETIQLPERDILQIQIVTVEQVNQKRPIQCFQNATDPVRPLITIQIVPIYPARFNCQTPTCVDVFLHQIQQRFESVLSYSMEIKNIQCILRLCSIDVNSVYFVGNMSSGRMYHASTLVSHDNCVHITGGFNPSKIAALVTTDKITIMNNSLIMSSGKNMSVARYDHTADLISSTGLVLIAGGMNSMYMPHNTAELFNSISGMTSTISMSTARSTHQSAVIPNSNKIVLIGGQNSSYLPMDSGDIFDGTKFTPVKNTMMHGRVGHTATYLPTINKVLITGGSNANTDNPTFFDTVELYDVSTNLFQALVNVRMSSRRAGHTATYIPVPCNKVFIFGGGSNQTHVLNTFDVFDVSTLSFRTSGTMKSQRTFHTATLLKNNKSILLAGGRTPVTDYQLASCELFNPITMSSLILKCLNEPRFFHTATLIPSTGNVLMCGGVDSNRQVLASCERFVP